MQILHYENGQKYEPHFDYFHDQANLELGGHRIATVLMYLSNVEKGGETVFPMWKVKTYITSGSLNFHLIFRFRFLSSLISVWSHILVG